VFLVIYIIEKLSRLVKRTRTPRKGELLIFFSFFFSLSFGLPFIIIIIFFLLFSVMCSRWSEFRYRSLLCCSENAFCKRTKRKKKEEDRVLLPFFMCLCVCLTEAEGEKRDATNTPATASTGC